MESSKHRPVSGSRDYAYVVRSGVPGTRTLALFGGFLIVVAGLLAAGSAAAETAGCALEDAGETAAVSEIPDTGGVPLVPAVVAAALLLGGTLIALVARASGRRA